MPIACEAARLIAQAICSTLSFIIWPLLLQKGHEVTNILWFFLSSYELPLQKHKTILVRYAVIILCKGFTVTTGGWCPFMELLSKYTLSSLLV